MTLEVTDEMFEDLPGGWLKRDEAQLLIDSAYLTEGPILEVGCYLGRSTVLLAHLGRQIHSVDPFENFTDDDPSGERIRQEFVGNILERGINNVVLHQMKVELWPAMPMGFAYLDGDHTFKGTVNQIRVALDCNVEYMCLHDYDTNPRTGGIQIAKAIASMPIKIETVVQSMAYCRKK